MMQNSEVDEITDPSSEDKDGAEQRPMLEEPEWPHDKIDLFDLANAAGQLVGGGESKPAALEDFFTKLKHLEHAWYEAEMKYSALKSANERLTNQLVHSRAKCAIYQKKLRFIQDNQKNFAKLKEVYMTMKCEEGGAKSFVDLKDRSTQTIPLTITVNSITNTVSIRKSEIGEAQHNLKVLKEMIFNREQTWELGKQIEQGLRSELRALQTQKATLEEIIVIKDSEIETLKSIQIKPSIREELFDNLKKIILKMDKRMKDLEKVGKIGRYIVIFSDKERQLLQDILENQSIQKINHSLELNKKESKTKEMPKRHASSSKSGLITLPKKVSQTRSSSTEKKQSSSVIQGPLRKAYVNEARELEALQKIRKEIEQKQSALREKVQQIIDHSGGRESSVIPTVT